MNRVAKPFLISTFLVSLVLAMPSRAANFNVQALPNNTFSPANLTIQAGDSVTWTNSGGLHNVRANDLSFECANGCNDTGGNGSPSTAPWQFTRTFNDPGTIGYNCQIHQGSGMVGSITVMAGGGNPGQLRFTSTNFNVNEGGGQATVTVARVNGSDGEVSVGFATSNGSAVSGSDYISRSGTLDWADADGANKSFAVTITDDVAIEGTESFNVALSGAGGGASIGNPATATVTISDNDQGGGGTPGQVEFSDGSFTAGEGDASAMVTVTRGGGDDGAASVDYSTADGTATAGSDYAATSGTLAWADGEDGGKSFSVPILDDGAPESSETVSLALAGAAGATLGTTAAATLIITDDDADTTPCDDTSDTTLCLSTGGRFEVKVRFTPPGEAPRDGKILALPVTDSGLFTFFDANNAEILVKVLNTCVFSNRIWVFFAATTNIEFVMTVRDTENGVMKSYVNPQGMAAETILDTDAFATCP